MKWLQPDSSRNQHLTTPHFTTVRGKPTHVCTRQDKSGHLKTSKNPGPQAPGLISRHFGSRHVNSLQFISLQTTAVVYTSMQNTKNPRPRAPGFISWHFNSRLSTSDQLTALHHCSMQNIRNPRPRAPGFISWQLDSQHIKSVQL
jgi:hypothetical protein